MPDPDQPPVDGACSPLDEGDTCPAGYKAVRCLRCNRRMFVAHIVWVDLPARHMLMAEHHAWLCPNPTPYAMALRRREAPPWH